MNNRAHITEELSPIAPLVAEIGITELYAVPKSYFASFADTVTERIRIEALLKEASVPVYEAPDGYFEQLPGTVLTTIQRSSEVKSELEEIAPLLSTIGKASVYEIPADYFVEADLARHARREQPAGAKRVSLRIARKWMQYAAAAVFAGVLITGAFLFTDNSANIEEGKYQSVDLSSELDKVSEADLLKYLDNPEHVAAAPATVQLASEADMAEVKNHLQNVSDEELKQYVTENAEVYETVTSEKEE